MTAPVSALFVGDGTLLIRCVETWLARGGQVTGIATNDSHIAAFAARHGFALGANDASLADFVKRKGCDYLFSAANLRLLEAAVLQQPRVLALNFHDGPLPEMPGLNVPLWAVLRGHARHAITWHEITVGIDAGRIAVARSFEVDPSATTFDVNAKCWDEGVLGFAEVCQQIMDAKLTLLPQPNGTREYFAGKKRPDRAAALNANDTMESTMRLCRALTLGPGRNPVGLPRIPHPTLDITFAGCRTEPGTTGALGHAEPTEGGLRVFVKDGAVVLSELQLSGREAVPPLTAFRAMWSDDQQATEAYLRATQHEAYWVKLLSAHEALPLALTPKEGPATASATLVSTPSDSQLLAAFAATLSRLSQRDLVDLTYSTDSTRADGAKWPFLSPQQVVRVSTKHGTAKEAVHTAQAALEQANKRGPFLRDLLARTPELKNQTLPDIELAFGPSAEPTTARLRLVSNLGRLELQSFGSATEQDLRTILAVTMRFLDAPADGAWTELQLLSAADTEIWATFNATQRPPPVIKTVPDAFVAQVKKTPHSVAVFAGDRELTYSELEQRSNQIAHALRRQGVGPDVLVGAYLDRELDTMVGLLAIHKAGGAYVPLDPHYPRERITHMLEDSRASVVVTTTRRRAELPAALHCVCVDDDKAFANESPLAPSVDLQPHHLAYAIYTSGSTGKPKGVLVEHRNVINFFQAMDEVVVAPKQQGLWLAVTSLSFDISVLELFYTLSRGYGVVLYSPPRPQRIAAQHAERSIDLGLFYFSSDVGSGNASYELLLEGARFADENGFSSVWTPERHFHAFGGLFPNSAVTLSALSQITKRVRLCAGSLVSPLHHPARIAEDFALVDNLSNGRVGVSFAAGWQPNDFIFAPNAFANRKDVMLDQLDQVRRLWRGESVEFTDGLGKAHPVKTLPRPVQKPIPVWLTAAANPDTFRAAAERGCHVLTHLLGQTFEEVQEKVALYRRVWKESGHPGQGYVTLMLHTFIGDDPERVKETVREPMKRYLGSAMDLVQKAAWTFPTFKQMTTSDGGKFSITHLSDKDKDAILEFSFERYYETSGLFGTPERALAILDRVKGIDVDEVACLVDFGVDNKTVLQSLPLLAEVRREAQPQSNIGEASVGDLMARHPITHFQCTPSMAGMLVDEPLAKAGLGKLTQMFVGGEALPKVLAERLKGVMPGVLSNMYGPTETTVWSTSFNVSAGETLITIGTPLLNNQCHIVDDKGRPLPIGWPGELWLSGVAVVRGYHQRPDLTAEKFVTLEGGTRAYRTGDLVRLMKRPSGRHELEFLGRIDHQVKIRGHRIELGEIEAVLERQPNVQRAVVVAVSGTGSDKRLVGYVEGPPDGARPDKETLRLSCRKALPEFMVPSQLMVLDRLPLTPNGKIDRKRLPAPDTVSSSAATSESQPLANELEEKIAKLWSELLGRDRIGRNDNFFDLGGHSLLAVQVTQRLKELLSQEVVLLDLFRHPTVEKLAKRLAGNGDDEAALKASSSRADARLAAMRARTRGR